MTQRPKARATALFHLYRGVSAALAPFAYRKISARLQAAGIPAARCRERLGHASLPRPGGTLVWFHAASVGESLSVLTLIDRLGAQAPALEFLITSGTATSAQVIAQRMPARCRHQFAPLDSAAAVDRFLRHWRPDLGVFVESELWPQMLVRSQRAGVSLVLLNARLSPRSVRGWERRPGTARFLLDRFTLILTQNAQTARNLMRLGADPARIEEGTNLKTFSSPLPVDQSLCRELGDVLAGRALWMASSTHEGEEEPVIAAHLRLRERTPEACLLLAPRHPERGDTVEALIRQAGLTVARRSRGEWPDADCAVYLADTLGELGSWYHLCPRVFLGGSLREIGGHNPFEPLRAGAALCSGPGTYNFAETFEALIDTGACAPVRDAASLAATLEQWFVNSEAFDAARAAGQAFIAQQADRLETVIARLLALLPETDAAPAAAETDPRAPSDSSENRDSRR